MSIFANHMCHVAGIRYIQGLVPYSYPPSILPDAALEENKPLDLSSSPNIPNSKPRQQEVTDSQKPLVELKVPQIFTNKYEFLSNVLKE